MNHATLGRISRAQARQIDRLAMERYGIPGIVLMENAARALEAATLDMLGTRRALIVCGGGNNGGDGLALARHLHNRGVEIEIALAADPAKYRGDALINWNIVRQMRLPWRMGITEAMAKNTLVIDALFGTGLDRPMDGPAAQIVRAINQSGSPVLAVDLPSGLDCDTGQPLGDCVRATRTVTFIAEKIGFADPESRQFTGIVSVGDIGCPPELIDEVLKSR